MVCERDGAVVWDGIIWTRTYQSQAKLFECTARTWPAYPERITFDANFTRSATEQRNIFIDLWNTMQSQYGCNIGVSVPGYFPSVVLKDLEVLHSEYKNFFAMMSALADGSDGFDWTIRTTKAADANYYNRDLIISYPFMGAVGGDEVAFDYPGSVTNYYQTENITDSGNNIILLGAGEGDEMLVSTFTDTTQIDSGFPRYDLKLAYKDITSSSLLSDLARQVGTKRQAPLTVIKVFTKSNEDPIFGSYGLGDRVALSIVDGRHPVPTTSIQRLVAYTFTPQSDDTVEQVELVFEGDELNE
jgi:hypothetical protein